MAFHLYTEEEQDMIALAKQFGEQSIDPVIAEFDEKGEFPAAVVDTGLEMGLQSLNFPEEWGGAGLSSGPSCARKFLRRGGWHPSA